MHLQTHLRDTMSTVPYSRTRHDVTHLPSIFASKSVLSATAALQICIAQVSVLGTNYVDLANSHCSSVSLTTIHNYDALMMPLGKIMQSSRYVFHFLLSQKRRT